MTPSISALVTLIQPSHIALPVVGVVLLSSLLHAAWNAIAKSLKDQVIAFGLIAVAAVIWALVVLTLVTLPARSSYPYLVVSLVFHILYDVTLLNSYRFGDLSLVYPIARGSAPLLVALGSFLVIGEHLTPIGIVGLLLITLGILSLARTPSEQTEHTTRATVLALGTGVAIAGYSIADGLGVRHAGSPLGYAAVLFLIEEGTVILGVLIQRRSALNAFWNRTSWLGLLGGVLSVTAYSLVLWAQTRAPLAAVSALRETSVVLASLVGVIVLHEGSAKRRITSALIVGVGAVVLILG